MTGVGAPGAGVFDDLVGQEPVAGELRNAAAAAAAVLRGEPNTGMTHAWLFTGPPGSGRSVAARAFAAALLCRDGGCGHCPSCHQVRAGTHADLLLVRPDGLSYGVRQTRNLVLRAAGVPSGGRWQVVLFEGADRATEQAANALLKAIEEPPPRTVWLLCAPSAEELVTTIRSRCRLVVLRTPPAEAISAELDEPERGALRRAFGEGSTGKGVAKAVRGAAGALRDLEDRQKSRATRLKRDALDRALLDLAAFYRDVLAVQLGAAVDLASAGHEADVRRQADGSSAEATVRRIEAVMACRERLELNVAPLLAVEEMT